MDENSLQDILGEAMKLVAELNGPGTGRLYHSLKHTMMVVNAALSLSLLADLSHWDNFIFVCAAAGHDIEQRLGSVKNEDQSGVLIGEIMRHYGVPEQMIGRVQELMSGTIVTWGVDGVMHQQAEQMNDRMAKLLADADLCSLGASRDEFVHMTIRLVAELAKKSVAQLTEEEITAGWVRQVTFMTGRKFLTPEANLMMGKQMEKNLAYARKMAGL